MSSEIEEPLLFRLSGIAPGILLSRLAVSTYGRKKTLFHSLNFIFDMVKLLHFKHNLDV